MSTTKTHVANASHMTNPRVLSRSHEYTLQSSKQPSLRFTIFFSPHYNHLSPGHPLFRGQRTRVNFGRDSPVSQTRISERRNQKTHMRQLLTPYPFRPPKPQSSIWSRNEAPDRGKYQKLTNLKVCRFEGPGFLIEKEGPTLIRAFSGILERIFLVFGQKYGE